MIMDFETGVLFYRAVFFTLAGLPFFVFVISGLVSLYRQCRLFAAGLAAYIERIDTMEIPCLDVPALELCENAPSSKRRNFYLQEL